MALRVSSPLANCRLYSHQHCSRIDDPALVAVRGLSTARPGRRSRRTGRVGRWVNPSRNRGVIVPTLHSALAYLPMPRGKRRGPGALGKAPTDSPGSPTRRLAARIITEPVLARPSHDLAGAGMHQMPRSAQSPALLEQVRARRSHIGDPTAQVLVFERIAAAQLSLGEDPFGLELGERVVH